MKIVILKLLLFMSFSANSENINIAIDLQGKSSFEYNSSRVLQEPTVLQIGSELLKKNSQKSLLIASGVEIVDRNDAKVSYLYNFDIEQKYTCEIVNYDHVNKLPELNITSKKNFVKNCLETYIQDKRALTFKENQSQCKVERVDRNTARFKGGYCFFKVSPDSQFNVWTKISSKCLDEKYLKNSDSLVEDQNVMLKGYLASDDSGAADSMVEILNSKVRVSINPEISKRSNYFDESAPAFLPYSGIKVLDFANISVVKMGSAFAQLKLGFLVNNICNSSADKKKHGDACAYALPLFGQYILKKNGAEIQSGTDGAIIAANWAGFTNFSSPYLPAESLTKGKYTLQLTFSDLISDYKEFKNGDSARRNTLRLNDSFPGNGDITAIGDVDTIGKTETVQDIPGIETEGRLETINTTNKIEDKWLSDILEICPGGESCKKIKNKLAEFTIHFELNENLEMKNIEIVKKSDFFGNNSKKFLTADQMTTAICN